MVRFVRTRREFLGSVVGGAAAVGMTAVLPSSLRLGGGDGSLTVVVLGDVHFDRLEHHDLEWLRREKPNDIRQVENYSRITREVLPSFMLRVKEQVRESGADFVFQLGDFVQGLCGTPELARRHLVEFIEFIESFDLGVPFVVVKGNHDVTGPGSVEAYDELVLPWQSKQVGAEQRSANMSFVRGNTRFVTFDAYVRESLDWFEAECGRRTEEHLVFGIHPPVVPYGARSTWHVFARENQRVQREKLLDLLGQMEATVLCGHLHRYGTVVREVGGGRFIQTALVSVLQNLTPSVRDERSGVGAFGPDLVELEPRFFPDTVDERRAALVAEGPFIRHYEYADKVGSAVLRIDGGAVSARLFSGVEASVWRQLDLTGLRDA